MRKGNSHRGLAAAIFICGVAACLIYDLTPPASAQSSDEAALRALVDKFYLTFQKKDLDGLMSLWCEQCPERAPARRGLRRTFVADERIEVGGLDVRGVELKGEQASARVSVEVREFEAATGKPVKGFGRLENTFDFRKSAGAWKIWRYAPSEDELAVALVATEKVEERAALLAGGNELLTPRLVKALLNQGLDFLKRKNPTRALDTYQLALELARRLEDRSLTAGVLRAIGYFYYFGRQNGQATNYLSQSLALAQEAGDKAQMARTLDMIGITYGTQGDSAKALESYQRGLALANEAGDVDAKDAAAYLLDHIANNLRVRDATRALESYRLSLKLAREVGNQDREMRTLYDMGGFYVLRGDYTQALDSYQQELAVAQESEDAEGISAASTEIGNVYFSQGDHERALEFYEKSKALTQGTLNQGFYATILSNIGNVYTAEGNYLKALDNYQQSLKLVAQEPNSKWRMLNFLNNIGYIHEVQGNYPAALEYYQECLKLAVESQNKAGRALALNNIGGIYYLQGDYEKALEFNQQSLKLSQETGDKQEISYAFNYIGDVYYAQGSYSQALEFYRKGLTLKEELGDKPEIAHALARLGEVYYAQEDYAGAAEFAERAAALADSVSSPERLREARTLAGKSYLALKQPERAAAALTDAINIIEDLRRQIAGGEQQQERFLENKVSPYYAMMELLLGRGDDSAALAYAERAKGRVLLDVLRGGRLDIAKAMTKEEREREHTLDGALVSLNTQIYRERLREHPDESRLSDLNARRQKARLDYDLFRTGLYASHPELRVQRGETPPFSADDARSLLPDSKTALLEFVVMEEKTLLFVLTRGEAAAGDGSGRVQLSVYNLNVGRKALAAQVEDFRCRLAARDLGFRNSARQLYELLLGPARQQLRGREVLCVVPDAALWDLPFQALQPSEKSYLIEEHAVFYAPSLSVLREMSKGAERRQAQFLSVSESNDNAYSNNRRSAEAAPGEGTPRTRLTLLAFANPTLSKETATRVAALPRDESAGPRPGSATEVGALGGGGGAAQRRIYIGAQAREETVKAEMGKYRVLHFATHGVLDDRNPLYSHLLLSQDANSPAEDGLLEAREIMNLNLRAELAVLSACQTARGRIGAGEGVIGMMWAFFIAGSPTTVVSLWDIESASTTQLMIEFHRQLHAQNTNGAAFASKALALRAASLKILGNARYRHPFYWAGFVMVGDGG